MRVQSSAALITVGLCLQVFFAQAGKDSLAVKYGTSITAADLNKHLKVLASDEYEGRETGEKGQKMAAEYIARFFESTGVATPPKHSYFQEFPLHKQYSSGVSVTVDNTPYRFLNDFFFLRGFQDTVLKTNEVVFLGYGEQDVQYSDYAGAPDITGKVVMFLAETPTDKKGNDLLKTPANSTDWVRCWRSKIPMAAEQGAAAVLVVLDKLPVIAKGIKHFLESPVVRLDVPTKGQDSGTPAFFITRDMANAIMADSKWSVKKLVKKMRKSGQSQSVTVSTDLVLDVQRKQEKMVAENVLGYIPGTDLKDELIVITAHYDHLG
ncbi:MAG: hypothetical protein AAGB22_13095, partial [Bacteroidota bacterium]